MMKFPRKILGNLPNSGSDGIGQIILVNLRILIYNEIPLCVILNQKEDSKWLRF